MNLAFLSYSHHDVKMAEWLQRKLEQFHLSKHYTNPVDSDCRYLRPIFRDRTDLSSGVLSEVIDRNLEISEYLIVLCSPHSAQSVWVSKEVQYFYEHGRKDKVIPIILEGEPYSGGPSECMPIYLQEYAKQHSGKELLCINLQLEGKHRTFMHVVARLLSVPFETFCDRYNRHLRTLATIRIAALSFVLGIVAFLTIPLKSTFQIVDQGNSLPHNEGTLIIDNQVYLINNYDTIITLPPIPGYKRGRSFDVSFVAPFYDTLTLSFENGYGMRDDNRLCLKRDDTFAIFGGTVLSDEGVPVVGAEVSVAGLKQLTDTLGHFKLELPLCVQMQTQRLKISKEGFEEMIREDECPDKELTYIIHSYNQ